MRWTRAARIASAVIASAMSMISTVGQRPPQAAAAASRFNVLLITIDTLRADHVGAYGDAAAITPNIDATARRGTRFDQAFAHAPLTFPSHASILTGELPSVHGARDNGWEVLDPRVRTVAARLRAAGYRTAAFVSSFILSAQFGLDRGFDVYNDRLRSGGPLVDLDLRRPAADVSKAAEQWILANGRAPFFAWVHFYDPHAPYGPPGRGRNPYDTAITEADAGVGRVVSALSRAGVADSTAVILTADHGEGLGDHGERQHGLLLYDSVMHVPLIVSVPGKAAGVVSSQVRHVDIAPTILALAGASSRNLPGRDLQATSGSSPSGGSGSDEEVYGESWYGRLHFGWSDIRYLRGGSWKYIDGPDPELYDVRHDAAESTNLIADRPALADAMRRRLHAIADATTAGGRGVHVAADSDTVERLRALGYVNGEDLGAPPGGVGEHRPDPKRMLAAFEAYETALNDGVADLVANRPARAVARFQKLVHDYPQSYGAHHYLGYALAAEGRDAAAIPEYERALRLNPQFAIAHFDVAKSLAHVGRGGDAVAHVDVGLRLEPQSLYGILTAGIVAWSNGDNLSARHYFQVATGLAPDEPRGFANLGEACMRGGDLNCARDAFQRLLQLGSSVAAAHFNLGVIAERLGAVREARQEYLSALAADPHLAAARQALTSLRAQ